MNAPETAARLGPSPSAAARPEADAGASSAAEPGTRRLADALRILCADAIERARSGHPGAPLGMAEMATVLWRQFLRHDPADPAWPDRDRFVLSNGHASMLQYALLHLSGHDLTVDDLRAFRQLHSRTPGHPEVGVTPGVETTTGPLGQGLANAVGLALAEQLLAAEYNRPGHTVIDHRTWVMLGDGCLMEGISQEAISLAGTLGLGKLIALYDDNGISIDGEVRDWFADDTAARFRACGWQVLGPLDGHDPQALTRALQQAVAGAHAVDARPTLLICRTTIGKGAQGLEGTAEVHGAPLGAAGIAALRERLDWPHPPFELPADIRAAWDGRAAGARARGDWQARFARYAQEHPALAAQLQARWDDQVPPDFAARSTQALAALVRGGLPAEATRRSSQRVLDVLAPLLPALFGGSADLTASNLTDFAGHRRARPRHAGNYLSWGVREFGMAAALNGMALHGGWIPYGGTFLTFSDYSRNAIRMAALMRQRVVHVFTHDSIALGEDGPTHQPVEHVAALRLIPQLEVWRPADLAETAVAWQQALLRADGPSALVLTRQAVPVVATNVAPEVIARGAYLLAEGDGIGGATPGWVLDLVLLATGSEVGLALAVRESLQREQGLSVRVVSAPCVSRIEGWTAAERQALLPPQVPTLGLEAGHPDGLRRWVGPRGAVHGIARYGESAPGGQLLQHFGFDVPGVCAAARALLQQA
ncbi:MAG: transketolase Tkt [Pseudomonadota bacterium]